MTRDRTKYAEVDRHFIKEKIESDVISMSYIPTKEQAADVLTKGLLLQGFEKLVTNTLGMINIHALTLGGVLADLVVLFKFLFLCIPRFRGSYLISLEG